MADQAEGLRRLAKKINRARILNGMEPAGRGRIITITSGKGGVGKTNIILALGTLLAQRNFRTLLIDADLGMANVNLLAGVHSRYSLADAVLGNSSISEVITTLPSGLNIIPGASGLKEMASLSPQRIEKLGREIELLENKYDLILIDTGAGISRNTMNFVRMSDQVLLLTIPESIAIYDAYSLIKSIAVERNCLKVNLLINRVKNKPEAEEIMRNFIAISEQFLNMKIRGLGLISEDICVCESVRERVPFIVKYPYCRAAKDIKKMLPELIKLFQAAEPVSKKGGLTGLFNFFLARLKTKKSFSTFEV